MTACLIAGCGFLGRIVGERLLERGYSVWGLRRTAGGLPQGFQEILADLSVVEPTWTLPASFEYVVYCVGPDDRSEDSYRAAYVDGFTNLARALTRQATAVRRLVFTSSTGVYGHDDGRWVDETTPPEPRTASARILVDAENAALASGLPVTVARLSGLYGPGRRRLIDRVRNGEALRSPGPPVFTNRIHRDDAAGAVVSLLQEGDPKPLILVSDDEPADRNDVIAWLADAMDVPPPQWSERAARGDGETNKRIANAALRATGFTPRYPTFRDGYTEVLRQFGLLRR